jgi:hypothetical protein
MLFIPHRQGCVKYFALANTPNSIMMYCQAKTGQAPVITGIIKQS